MRKTSNVHRRGAILPLFALMLVGLVGFLALAIDIGIVAVAETQCQNAADNAALAGCRALNGDDQRQHGRRDQHCPSRRGDQPDPVARRPPARRWPCSTAPTTTTTRR